MDNNKLVTGISVIICTYNGKNRLEMTLDHIISQDIDSSILWEVIIIDNASTDQSYSFVEQYLLKSNSLVNFKLYHQPKPGKQYALELGYQKAKYDFIVICDDDNWLSSNYLQTAFNIMKLHPSIGLLGGCGEGIFEVPPPNWFVDFSYNYAIGEQGKATGKTKQELYGAGMIIRKSAYNQLIQHKFKPFCIGRTGESNTILSGTDTELSAAIRLLGYDIYYSENLRFKHFITKSRLNWDYLLRLRRSMIYANYVLGAYKLELLKLPNNYLVLSLVTIYYCIKSIHLFTIGFIKGNSRAKMDSFFYFLLVKYYFNHAKAFISIRKSIKMWNLTP